MNFYPAPRWTPDDFTRAQLAATDAFRQERLIEPADLYGEAFLACKRAIIDLFSLSVSLTRPLEVAVEITSQPMLLEVLRYLTGPPVSEDDLKVLTGASLAPARLRKNPDMARRVIETIWGAVDPNRFPWVRGAAEPTTEETEAAVLATAAMMATRRIMTARANQAKTHQEELVTARLRTEGFEEVRRRRIRTLEDAPQRGTYCGESLLGSRKADVVVRLRDGRLMAIECKVSNSSTNSVKRLNNDAAAKASSWISEFGTAATVPSVVLSGVFKTHNLLQAQDQGLTVFWAHDLDSLATFLAHAQ